METNRIGVLTIALMLTLPSFVLAEDGLTLRGQVRPRMDRKSDYGFNAETPDDARASTAITQRARIGVDGVRDSVSYSVELQDVRSWGSEPNTVRPATSEPGTTEGRGDDKLLNTLDMSEAWLALAFTKEVSLKLGRQTLSYGDQRLVGGLDWFDEGRHFDAAKVSYVSKELSADVFAAKLNNTSNAQGKGLGSDFYGLYASWLPAKGSVVDLYYLLLQDHDLYACPATVAGCADTGIRPPAKFTVDPASPDVSGAEIHTVGLRGRTQLLDESLRLGGEVALQMGTWGQQDINAYATHADVGYWFTASEYQPWVRVEANLASGNADDCAGSTDPACFDKTRETFTNLFPTNHMHYGYMDLAAWSNVQHFGLAGGFTWKDKNAKGALALNLVNVELALHHVDLATTDDAWYDAGGAALRKAPVSSTTVGDELDLQAVLGFGENTKLLLLYGVFVPGAYIEDSNPASVDNPAKQADTAMASRAVAMLNVAFGQSIPDVAE